MNYMQNNEPNPLNKHSLQEFKRKIDISNFPAEHEAEIDHLLNKSKHGQASLNSKS